MFIQQPFNLTGGAAAAAGYVPEGAIWLNGTDEYLSWTPGSAGNRKTWTISAWVKRSDITSKNTIIGAGTSLSDSGEFIVKFNDTADGDQITAQTGSTVPTVTSAVYRDPTAWQHVVYSCDTTLASNQFTLIVNGVVVTALSTDNDLTQNTDTGMMNNVVHEIGRFPRVTGQYFNGYLSEVIVLDGTASIDASEFGEFNSDGVWIPKDPTDTVTDNKGTNGFWLDFADSSDLGNDVSYSGLGVGTDNSFTANNMAAANFTNDRPADSGEDIGNYATMNPLDYTDGNYQFSEGNNKVYQSTASNSLQARSTLAIPPGAKIVAWSTMYTGSSAYVGICDDAMLMNSNPITGQSVLYYDNGQKIIDGGTATSYGASYGNSDLIRIEVDLSVSPGTIEFFKNDSSQGVAYSSLDDTIHWYFVNRSKQDGHVWQFGAGGLPETPTSGFLPLNTANFPAPSISKPSDHFLPIVYEGNGGGQRVGNFIPFTDSHTVDNSCMFDAGDGLTRTPGTATNLKKWTFSTWIKPGDNTRGVHIIAGDWNANYTGIRIQNSGRLMFEDYQLSPSTWHGRIDTVRLFDQYDAWVHIFFRYDSATSTTPDGDDIYFAINGVQVTNFYDDGGGHPTYPAQNRDTNMNSAVLSSIGGAGGTNVPSTEDFDGYMAETIMVDGYALSPSVFGQTDTSTNRWIPKEVTAATLNTAGGGSSGFGDEGFYLEYGTGADLGDDTSGETNDWTELNLAAANQSVDTPTKNYCTWSPLEVGNTGTPMTYSNGNLTAAGTAVNNTCLATMGMSSGKWYWEWKWDSGGTAGNKCVGIAYENVVRSGGTGYLGGDALGWGYYGANGKIYHKDAVTTYGTALVATNIVGIALDMDIGAVWFSVNGTWQTGTGTGDSSATILAQIEAGTTENAAVLGLSGELFPAFTCSDVAPTTVNFGQNSFNTAAPSGFLNLNQDNLAENTASITGFSWIKNRDVTESSVMANSVRGIYKYLESDDSVAEATDTNTVQRFLQQGVQIGNMDRVNTFEESFVLWQWANAGSTSTNNDGTIPTAVSLNSTAGFVIGTYTANDTGSATIGHGLGQEPDLYIIKQLGGGNGHVVHHKDMTYDYSYCVLNTAADEYEDTVYVVAGVSATTITFGSTAHGMVNLGGDYLFYAWHSVEGYSKFGTYEGNNDADGPFINTGFRPSYLWVKNIDATGNWWCVDEKRSPYNQMSDVIFLDSDSKEEIYAGIDFTANGFKLRSASTSLNGANTFVYAAFAENPFGGSGVAQARAR